MFIQFQALSNSKSLPKLKLQDVLKQHSFSFTATFSVVSYVSITLLVNLTLPCLE